MRETMREIQSNGQIVDKARPSWVDDPNMILSEKDIEEFSRTEFGMPTRRSLGLTNFDVDIVYRDPYGDVIYQFLNVTVPKFDEILATVIEEHFGSTDFFRVRYEREISAWGLLAKQVRQSPLYNRNHYEDEFVGLVDDVLTGLR